MKPRPDDDVAARLALQPEKPDVYYARASIAGIDRRVIAWLTAKAGQSPRTRCRICFHANVEATIHEMLIAHHRENYVRPHRHPQTGVSLVALQGTADILLFDADGRLTAAPTIGSDDPDADRYLRIPPNTYYSFLVKSDWLVFLETMQGPFTPTSSEWAPWAPEEGSAAARDGRAALAAQAARFKAGPESR